MAPAEEKQSSKQQEQAPTAGCGCGCGADAAPEASEPAAETSWSPPGFAGAMASCRRMFACMKEA